MAAHSYEPSPKRRRLESLITIDLARYYDRYEWLQYENEDENLVRIFELGLLVRESTRMTVDFDHEQIEKVLASKMEPIQSNMNDIEEEVGRQVSSVRKRVTEDVGKSIKEVSTTVQELTGTVNEQVLSVQQTVTNDVRQNIVTMNNTVLELKQDVSRKMLNIKEELCSQVNRVAEEVLPLNTVNNKISESAKGVKSQVSQEFQKSEQRILDEMKDFQTKLSELTTSLERPSKKGSLGERNVLTILQEHFPNFTVTDVSSQQGKGDINVVTNREHKIMVEVKNHQNPVAKSDIERFEKTLSESADFKVGILISWGSEIARIPYGKMFEIAVRPNQYLIYIPKAHRDENLIVWSIIMADELTEIHGELGESKRIAFQSIYANFCEKLENTRKCRSNLESLKTCIRKLEENITPVLDVVEKAKEDLRKLLR